MVSLTMAYVFMNCRNLLQICCDVPYIFNCSRIYRRSWIFTNSSTISLRFLLSATNPSIASVEHWWGDTRFCAPRALLAPSGPRGPFLGLEDTETVFSSDVSGRSSSRTTLLDSLLGAGLQMWEPDCDLRTSLIKAFYCGL